MDRGSGPPVSPSGDLGSDCSDMARAFYRRSDGGPGFARLDLYVVGGLYRAAGNRQWYFGRVACGKLVVDLLCLIPRQDRIASKPRPPIEINSPALSRAIIQSIRAEVSK